MVETKWLMFRARRKDNGKWIYGCPVPIGNKFEKINFDVWGIVEYGYWDSEPVEIDYDTLQKFANKIDNDEYFVFCDRDFNYVYTTATKKDLFPTSSDGDNDDRY